MKRCSRRVCTRRKPRVARRNPSAPGSGGKPMKAWLISFGVLTLAGPLTRIAAQAPPGRVAGVVTGETGEPVAGASIIVVGTRAGAVTNAQGRYTIAGIVPGNYRVRVSM